MDTKGCITAFVCSLLYWFAISEAEKRDKVEFTQAANNAYLLVVKGGQVSYDDFKMISWSVKNRPQEFARDLHTKGLNEEQINKVFKRNISLK